MAGEMLTHALQNAARGLRVFRLGVRDWRPAFRGWRDEATTDPLEIMEMWSDADYNIGVAAGEGLLVIDVDDKPGKHGSQSLEAFKLNGSTYDTLTVRTPTGGRHLYYRGPNVSNSAGALGVDLDVRSEGGYVVGPGSILDAGTKNAVGGVYALERDAEPREVPEAFLARLSAFKAPASRDEVVELDSADAVVRGRDYLQHTAPIAVEGQAGDQTTFVVAATLKDMGLSEETCAVLMTEHWLGACESRHPWGERVTWMRQKVANAYAYGKNPPGIDHPAHTFEGVHIEPIERPGRKWFHRGDDWAGSVSWLYKDLLPTQGVCILTAPSGAGKTFVAMHLSKSVADGTDFFGVEPKHRGSVIYLVGEAYGSAKQRLAALGAGTGISLTFVGGLAARGAWGDLCTDILAEAEHLKQTHGHPVRLIVLDTLSASAILEDEDNNALAATVMRLFADLAAALNGIFLVVHHPPKSGQGSRGAGAITNNADYVLEIDRKPHANVRDLIMTKSRDGEQRDIGAFTLVKTQIGWEEGEPVTTMLVQTGKARTPTQKEKEETIAHLDLLLQALEMAAVDSTVTVEGEPYVEYKAMEGYFLDLFPNRQARPDTVRRALTHCVTLACDVGRIARLSYFGRQYLKNKEITPP